MFSWTSANCSIWRSSCDSSLGGFVVAYQLLLISLSWVSS